MEKNDKTEIKKIVLNLQGKEVSLTVEQAKKLKDLLSEMFGRDVVKEVHYHDSTMRWWQPPYPNWSSVEYTVSNNTLSCSL